MHYLIFLLIPWKTTSLLLSWQHVDVEVIFEDVFGAVCLSPCFSGVKLHVPNTQLGLSIVLNIFCILYHSRVCCRMCWNMFL